MMNCNNLRSICYAVAAATALCGSAVAAGQDRPAQGLNLWLGLDLGTMQSEADNTAVETSKAGAIGGGKVFFSRFSESLVLEGGLGWQTSRLRNPEPRPAASAEDEQNGTVDREIVETRAAVGEIAVRYKNGGFEVGPAAQVMFGADTTFSPYLGVEDKSPNGFGGLGLYYTFYGESMNQRIGLQFMTDLTIDKRQISSSQLQYYVSIPFFNNKPREKVVVKYKEKTRYIVDAGFINFETGKYAVGTADQKYLSELGTYLAKNAGKWSLVFITSHTDHRGGDEINLTLSQNRAKAISELLNLPESFAGKVQVRSRASGDPVEKQPDVVSMARNRRVEIEIVGAIDVVGLKREIALIKQKHRKPDTCVGENCQ